MKTQDILEQSEPPLAVRSGAWLGLILRYILTCITCYCIGSAIGDQAHGIRWLALALTASHTHQMFFCTKETDES